eukprot:556902-Pelagomonas_calceolata.AAC.1
MKENISKSVQGEWQADNKLALRKRLGEREERAREQGSILEPKRADLGLSAFKDNMLSILYIILGMTKFTGRRNSVTPYSLLIFENMDTKTKLGYAANNVLSEASRMIKRKTSPVCQVKRPEIHSSSWAWLSLVGRLTVLTLLAVE